MNRFQNLAFLAAVAGVAMFTVGTAAEAAVIGTATLIKDPAHGIPFAAPDAALGAPWVSYELGLASNAGELIGAVNVLIHGPLHQRWVFNEDTGVFDSTHNSTNRSNGDSHVHNVSGLLFYTGPNEDNSGVGSPLADTPNYDYGVGTFLTDVWGITGPTTTASLAYVVFPADKKYDFDISVQVADPNGNIIDALDETDFFPTPEPTTWSMIGTALACFAGAVSRNRSSGR